MPTVADVLSRKSQRGTGEVVSVEPDATVLDAVRAMNDRKIGSVIVVDPGSGTVAGIFTERDLLTRVVAERRSPETTRVSQVMTTRVVCCNPQTRTDELRSVMHEKRVRHVPVVDHSRAIGLVSLGDLNTVRSEDLEQTVQYLELYLRS